jgi:ATP-dependent DNA helicase RecG
VITLAALQSLVARGESETLEFKRSTAELRRAGETLCAFLKGDGGQVLIGVGPDGRIVGQQVADITLRDIAAMLGRFEPHARVEMSRVDVGDSRQVIVLDVAPARQHAPFVFGAKPFKRVGTTTTVMSQEEYSTLLPDRNHSWHRWENQPADGVRLEDLDHEEILRTRQTAIEHRRLSAGTSMDVGDILDRLGLRIDGQITQAAQMLYGTKFLPDYPQALLKLGRFRGTKITGDILDNKQEYLHAFAMVREAIAWLDRTLPLSARFPPGAINREDRLPVPAEGLREIVINAVIHRDVSHPSSYVAIAVFDDRIEIHSIGAFPTGIRAELLTQEHRSIPRNPLIAGAFHRTGAIEGPRHQPGHRRVPRVRHRRPDVHRGLGRRHGDVQGGGCGGLGTRRVSSRSQVGPKCGPSPSPGNRERSAKPAGADGPLGTQEQDAVQGPSRGSSARSRADRDDHPRQAAELEAAVPHDGRRARDSRGCVMTSSGVGKPPVPEPPGRAKPLPRRLPLAGATPDLVSARMINETLYCERLVHLEASSLTTPSPSRAAPCTVVPMNHVRISRPRRTRPHPPRETTTIEGQVVAARITRAPGRSRRYLTLGMTRHLRHTVQVRCRTGRLHDLRALRHFGPCHYFAMSSSRAQWYIMRENKHSGAQP